MATIPTNIAITSGRACRRDLVTSQADHEKISFPREERDQTSANRIRTRQSVEQGRSRSAPRSGFVCRYRRRPPPSGNTTPETRWRWWYDKRDGICWRRKGVVSSGYVSIWWEQRLWIPAGTVEGMPVYSGKCCIYA